VAHASEDEIMKCSKCGADNPESAEYCSLCLERLQAPGAGAYPPYQPGRAPVPGTYVAPGEWRGDAEALSPTVSKVMDKKLKRFRLKLVVYGLFLAMVAAWLVVSFTVWGNPSPGKRSMQLIEALNNRDLESFEALILPEARAEGEKLYQDTAYFLGEKGKYVNLKLDVSQANDYDARSFPESGSIEFSGTRPSISISGSDKLVIVLESHKGKWYVNPRGTVLTPLRT